MKSYTLRSAIVLVIFMNLIVITAALLHSFSFSLSLWWSLFFVLLILSIIHKKQGLEKAFLNIIILLLLAIPIAGISMPINLIIKGFYLLPIRSTLYIFISLICLLYLCIRHQRYTILDLVSKMTTYMFEIKTIGLKSNFAMYLIFETMLFVGSLSCWFYFGS